MKLNSNDLLRAERALSRQIRQNVAAVACDDTNMDEVILDIAQDVKSVTRIRQHLAEQDAKSAAQIEEVTQKLRDLKQSIAMPYRTSTAADYKECGRRAQQYGWQVDHIANIFMALTSLKQRVPSLPTQHNMFNLLIPVNQTALNGTELSRVTGITDTTFPSHEAAACYPQMLAMIAAAPLRKNHTFDKTVGFDKSLYTPVCEWVTEHGTALVYKKVGERTDYIITMVIDKGRIEYAMFFLDDQISPSVDYDCAKWKMLMSVNHLSQHYLYFTKATDDGLLLQRVYLDIQKSYYVYESRSHNRAMPETVLAYDVPVHLTSHWQRTANPVAAGNSVDEVYGLLQNL